MNATVTRRIAAMASALAKEAASDRETDDQLRDRVRVISDALQTFAVANQLNGGTPQMRPYVKLYKDGDQMGVETNADTPEVFCTLLSEALAEMIERKAFVNDWEFQLGYWLPASFEIVARLRGYKADVQEERVIIAGAARFPNQAVAGSSGLGDEPSAVVEAQ